MKSTFASLILDIANEVSGWAGKVAPAANIRVTKRKALVIVSICFQVLEKEHVERDSGLRRKQEDEEAGDILEWRLIE